jgi:hypothetical protein
LAIATPFSSTIGSVVIRASENRNSLAPSSDSPVIVTSTVSPAVPPIGIVVSNRGIGRQTDWEKADEAIKITNAQDDRMTVQPDD